MPRPPVKSVAIADLIARRIDLGEIVSGAWLPSERELARAHRVDRSTVRRVLKALAERGLVEVHPGLGCRVLPQDSVSREADDVTRQFGDWRGFHVSAARAGLVPYTRTSISARRADPEVARWLAVPVAAPVVARVRLQGVADHPPIQTSTSWIPSATIDGFPVLRNVDTGPGGMYSRFEDAGHVLRFEETVTCRLPSSAEQERLAIAAQEPVLVVWRRCFDGSDRVLEVTHRVIVGGRQELVYRYDTRS